MRDDIILLDCGMGTTAWDRADDKLDVFMYSFLKPELIKDIHKDCIEAGSGIILANTFSANQLYVDWVNKKNKRKAKKTGEDFHAYTVEEIVAKGMEIAKEAAGDKAKVALDVGPLSKLLEPYGNLSEAEAREIYQQQISSGMAYEPDMIYLETFQDLALMRIAVSVARQYDVPVFCSFSFEENGRTLMGNSVEDIVRGLEEFQVDALGLNCSFGPKESLPIIEAYSKASDIPIIFKPNAGKPVVDEDGNESSVFDMEDFTKGVMKALDSNVKYVGGCCGSKPEYIRSLHEALASEE